MVTKRNKILIASISTAALIVGGGVSFAAFNNTKPETKKHTNKSNDKDDAKKKNESQSSSSSIEEIHKGSWSISKQGNLSNFMKTWQQSMDQEYDGTYDGKQPNHYGIIFPDHIIEPLPGYGFEINNQPATLHWNPAGDDLSGNAVVAVATGWVAKDPTPFPLVTYFFTISNGEPVVYVTQTNNGEILYLTRSENTDLKKGFADIFYK